MLANSGWSTPGKQGGNPSRFLLLNLKGCATVDQPAHPLGHPGTVGEICRHVHGPQGYPFLSYQGKRERETGGLSWQSGANRSEGKARPPAHTIRD